MNRLEARDMLSVSLFSALTTVGSFISVPLPFSPVPITLQTMFTYMAGALLGGGLGALSQLIYVLIGICGLPIFAGGKTGPSVLIGPTGGYLIGFISGAFVIGKMSKAKKNRSLPWLLACMIVGTSIIYASGILQLMNWMNIGFEKAIMIGVAPFIAGDLLKMLMAAYATDRIRRTLPESK